MVASEVWDAETKPKDFVCNRAARRAMNIVAGMESALVRIELFLCGCKTYLLSISLCLSILLSWCIHLLCLSVVACSLPSVCLFVTHLFVWILSPLLHLSSLAEWLQWRHHPLQTGSATLHAASRSILGEQISMLAHAWVKNPLSEGCYYMLTLDCSALPWYISFSFFSAVCVTAGPGEEGRHNCILEAS